MVIYLPGDQRNAVQQAKGIARDAYNLLYLVVYCCNKDVISFLWLELKVILQRIGV